MYEYSHSKSIYPSKFYYNYCLPALKLGFISNFSHFLSFHIVEFNSSVSKLAEQVGFALETWARLHRVSWKRLKLGSMATFLAKHVRAGFFQESDSKLSKSGIKEKIELWRFLKKSRHLDRWKINMVQSVLSSLLNGPLWKQHHAVTHLPVIYTGWVSPKF